MNSKLTLPGFLVGADKRKEHPMLFRNIPVAAIIVMIFTILLSPASEGAPKKEKGKSKAGAVKTEKRKARLEALKKKNPELFRLESQANGYGDELVKLKDQVKDAKMAVKNMRDKAKDVPEAEQKKFAEEYTQALKKMYDLQEKQMDLRLKIGENKLENQRIRTGMLKEELAEFKVTVAQKIEKDVAKLFKAKKEMGARKEKKEKKEKKSKEGKPEKGEESDRDAGSDATDDDASDDRDDSIEDKDDDTGSDD